MSTADGASRPRGRPRDLRLDAAILAAAETRLREHGYAGMSFEAVAALAGTTVPSLRRRFRKKEDLAAAVVDSLRVKPLPPVDLTAPRRTALAVLQNFRANLARPQSMALLGSLLAEEDRHPELLDRFRTRLVEPRRERVRAALAAGVAAGELPVQLDLDAAVNMLIGAFYARYVSGKPIPKHWPESLLRIIWPG